MLGSKTGIAKGNGAGGAGGTFGAKPTGAGAGGGGAGSASGAGGFGLKPTTPMSGTSAGPGGGTSGVCPAGTTFGSKAAGSALAVAVDDTVTIVPVSAATISVLRTLFKSVPFAVRAPKQTHTAGRPWGSPFGIAASRRAIS